MCDVLGLLMRCTDNAHINGNETHQVFASNNRRYDDTDRQKKKNFYVKEEIDQRKKKLINKEKKELETNSFKCKYTHRWMRLKLEEEEKKI